MNEAGYSVEYFALEIEIILSSNGWRITSKTERLNSGSSSKRKNLSYCNSLIINYKAPKTTAMCTIKPFITTKIQTFLANLKNNVDIYSCSLAEIRLSMVAGLHQKTVPVFPTVF